MKIYSFVTKVIVILLLSSLIYSDNPNSLNDKQSLDRESQELSNPEINFEYLWKQFDSKYALFDVKNIDWNLVYNIYRPNITSNTTDDELFVIMSEMLGLLNDFHVTLVSKDFKRLFRSGRSTEIMWDRFDNLNNFYQYIGRDPISENYAKGEIMIKDNFTYTWVTDDIGYFHFGSFYKKEQSSEIIDDIVEYFKHASGLIIDVRRNVGGDDYVGKAIADRFADRKRLYMISRVKDGPNHNDYSKKEKWYIETGGNIQFTNPIILLTDLYTMSAAENFTLSLRELPHVNVVGDFTSGVHGNTETDSLPNGWEFRVSTGIFTDKDGFCWEGIGIPPDYRIANTIQDDENGKDRVLEFAIKFISTRLSDKDKP